MSKKNAKTVKVRGKGKTVKAVLRGNKLEILEGGALMKNLLKGIITGFLVGAGLVAFLLFKSNKKKKKAAKEEAVRQENCKCMRCLAADKKFRKILKKARKKNGCDCGCTL